MTPDPVPSGISASPSKALWLAGVFAVFFLLACAGLVPFAWQAKRDYRVAKVYVESEAEIIEFIPINSGYSTRPGERSRPSTRPSFVFRFATKEGATITTRGYDAYGGREAPASEWNTISAGERVPCWYDPANPKQAVLSRRFNPHFYWLLALPLGIMVFTGLLLRECLRRAAPPRLKGIEPGRHLAWRLPPVASQQAMTGCLGVAMVILALLTSGFVQAALDYKDTVYEYRWISRVFGFNMNGWWVVALVTSLVTLLFVWAFLVNLRWIVVPEPGVEVNASRLLRGQSTLLHITQAGPLKAETYTVSLICEINGTPGKPPAIQEVLFKRDKVVAGPARDHETVEFCTELTVPSDARSTRNSVSISESGTTGSGDLVGWFIRIERKVSAKNTLQSDFEILVGPETA